MPDEHDTPANKDKTGVDRHAEKPTRRRRNFLILLLLVFAVIVVGMLVFWPYYARQPLGSLKLRQCPQNVAPVLIPAGSGDAKTQRYTVEEHYIFQNRQYLTGDFDVKWVKAHCNLTVETSPHG